MDDRVLYRDLAATYPQVDRGEGVYLYDVEGKRYLDFVGGAAVVTIGHGVPEIAEAMARQARRIAYTYGAQFTNEPQQALAAKVIELAPAGMDKVYFVSGGSEATETALKLIRQYFLARGKPNKWKVIGRWQSYHGNTMGAMAMSGRTSWRRDFGPYLADFPHLVPCYCYRCPFGQAYPACEVRCATDLERLIRQEGADTIAAFVAEPIVGTSGAGLTPPAEYYRIIREICDRHDVLFLADEIITGFGRTGRNFGVEHWGVVPDMMVVGKAISSGYTPLGAVILHARIVEAFRESKTNPLLPFTFAGNPLSAAVGLAVQEYAGKHRLFERVRTLEPVLVDRLAAIREHPHVGEVRGKGLLVGIELVADKGTKAPFPTERNVGRRAAQEAKQRGLLVLAGQPGLIDGVMGDHLLLAPPFVVTEAQLAEGLGLLREAIDAACAA